MVQVLNPELEDLGSRGSVSQIHRFTDSGPPAAGGSKTTSEQVWVPMWWGCCTKVPGVDLPCIAMKNPPGVDLPCIAMKNPARTLMVPCTASPGAERKRLEIQQKNETPNPTVLPLETLSLPGLALKSSAFGFRIHMVEGSEDVQRGSG